MLNVTAPQQRLNSECIKSTNWWKKSTHTSSQKKQFLRSINPTAMSAPKSCKLFTNRKLITMEQISKDPDGEAAAAHLSEVWFQTLSLFSNCLFKLASN